MSANTLQVSGLSYHQLPETVKRDLFNAFIADLSVRIQQKKLADFFIEQLMLANPLAHDKSSSTENAPSLDFATPHKAPESVNSKHLEQIMKIFHRYLDEINKITSKLDLVGAKIRENADTIVNLLAKAAHVPAATVAPTVYSTLRHMAAHIAHSLGFAPHAAPAAAATATPSSPVAGLAGAATIMAPATSIPAPSAPPAPVSALLPTFTATTAPKDPEKKEETSTIASTPTLTPSTGKKGKKAFLDYFTRVYSSLLQRLLSLDRPPSGLNHSLRTFGLNIIDEVTLLQRLDERLRSVEQFLQHFSAPHDRNTNTTSLSSYTIGHLLAQQGFFPEPQQITDTAPRPYWITTSRRQQRQN